MLSFIVNWTLDHNLAVDRSISLLKVGIEALAYLELFLTTFGNYMIKKNFGNNLIQTISKV